MVKPRPKPPTTAKTPTSRKPGGQKPFYGLGVVEKMSDIMA